MPHPLLHRLFAGVLARIESRPPRLHPSDLMLASYPKSGNTWTRFLFANILKPDPGMVVDFKNVQDLTPELGRHNARIRAMKPPRHLKTHSPFDPRLPRAIHIVRDGRDAYISYFHFRRHALPPGMDLAGFIREIPSPYGRWSDHVRGWLRARAAAPDRILLVRYEDMHRDIAAEFGRMLRFAGLNPPSGAVEAAIRESSFGRMKDIERDRGSVYKEEAPDPFMRKGERGEWRSVFGPAEREAFERLEDVSLLRELGYPAFDSPAGESAAAPRSP